MKIRACVKFLFLFSTLIAVLGVMPCRVGAQVFTVLHAFTPIDNSGTNRDGAQPMGSVVYANGKLYGTTSTAGPGFGGTVFSMNMDGSGFTNVCSFPPGQFFNFPNGSGPEGRLIVSNNILYGTTEGGGVSGWGVVFRLNTEGSDFTNIHNFSNGSGGSVVRGGLVLAGNTLYGTTESGNSANQGIIFSVGTDGSGFTNLHGFSASSGGAGTFGTNSDGVQPNRNLVISGNTLYGTAQYGGTNGYGTVFSLNTNGSGFTTLHTFTAPDPINITNSDGANPSAGMLLSGNRLIGTTRVGGPLGFGIVFAMNTDGTGFTNLYSLRDEDGNTANAGLALATNTLYGVTIGTSTNSAFAGGGMFSVSTNGTGFKNLYEFSMLMGGNNTNGDGFEPWDSLIIVSNVLYGTARNGGVYGEGTVYALDLSAPTPAIQFTASPTNGSVPLDVQFLAPSVDADGHPITSWLWDFGDGGTSTEQNPMHEYDLADTYVPSLLATNIRGGTVIGVGPEITVLPITEVGYSADVTNGAAPLTVSFSSSGDDTMGNTIATWFWDFGDGFTGTGENPSHIYNTPGDYTVTLLATNTLGGLVEGVGPSAIGVTQAVVMATGHRLLAYYSFDDSNLAATDFSDNDNNLGYPFDYNGGSANLTEDALTPPEAVDFENNGGAGFAYYYTESSNLLAALSGSFSVSLWVKTAQVSGSDTDDGVEGNAGIVNTFEDYVVPMALTGNKVCFLTADAFGDALHSTTSINSNVYMHVVVTRDEASGEKKIYVNGALDASDVGETGILPNGLEMEIGSGNGTGFQGKLDEIQIYAGVLSADDVAQLYNNPGTTIPDGNGDAGLGMALNATNLVWTTGGDADWFVETNTTYDGVSAAQSGAITDSQTNWVETTVPADGQVSFWWKVSSEDGFDYLTFYINGVQQDAISGEIDWTNETFNVAAGDTLRWEYSKDDSGSSGSDAGWLDEVQYVSSAGAPVNVTMLMQIQRYHDYGADYEDFEAFPSINSVDPAPITTNRLVSPDGFMYSEVWAGDTTSDTGIGEGFTTLDNLIYACTNGVWTLYINKDSVAQQVYHFKASLSGLTTNVLAPIIVFSPAPNSMDVPTNAPLYWMGPTNMQGLFVEAYQSVPTFAFDGATGLDPGLTNWPSPPALLVGTNEFYIQYSYGFYPGVTFSTPVDGDLNPIAGWSTEVDLFDLGYVPFVVVGGGAVSPIELVLLKAATGNMGFTFQTGNGSSETVQSSTNLLGGWSDVTNFMGDGSVRQFTFPTTNGTQKYYRVKQQ